MNWRKRWVVLVPGEVAWVERRTREVLADLEERDGTRYTIVPGRGSYQAIVQEDQLDDGPEVLLGHALSLQCKEPVYAIERRTESPCISRFLNGEESYERQEAEELVRTLGCVMPWSDEPLSPPSQPVSRTVVLIQGLSKVRVSDALEKLAERPLAAGYYCLEEVPQGLLLRDGAGRIVFEDIRLAHRFPRATMYAVMAKPDLAIFHVWVRHRRKTEEFVLPPREFPQSRVLHEVMGERTPERILAALGISKEWFQL